MQTELVQQLASAAQTGGFMISSDSWKRRCAVSGASLLTFNATLPSGGSRFYDVLVPGAVSKTATWIYDQHVIMAERMSPGKPGA